MTKRLAMEFTHMPMVHNIEVPGKMICSMAVVQRHGWIIHNMMESINMARSMDGVSISGLTNLNTKEIG